MANILNLMPELDSREMAYLQGVVNHMTDEQAQQFVNIYRSRRRDPMLVLITAAIGLVGVAGVHRFLLGHIGMGLLYIFTGGLCFVGTIIDMINYKRLAFEYNAKEAQQVQAMMSAQFGSGTGGYY